MRLIVSEKTCSGCNPSGQDVSWGKQNMIQYGLNTYGSEI